MFYQKQNHFYITQKKLFQGILFVLVFTFSCLALKGSFSFPSAKDYEIMVLWKEAVTNEEAADRLSSLMEQFTLTDHISDLSVCTVHTSHPAKLLAALNRADEVRIAELNTYTTLSSLSDSEFYPTQWALDNPGEYPYYINNLSVLRPSVADIDINLPEAYSLLAERPDTRSVTVAVIDTGVDINHPALADHIWINEKEIPGNGIDDDGNGYVDDVCGWDFYHNDNTVCHYGTTEDERITALAEDDDTHGTHCAGIIAASGSVVGVASGVDVRILPLKIHGGTNASGTIANAVKAIKYAQLMGADICNLSWGTVTYSELLETVMREADMLFVVAAGNNSANNNAAPLYPASFSLDNMISVAYITPFGTLAADSNYGTSSVDIAAPGQDIYSTVVGGGYRYRSGSSMATPVVTGVAALLYAQGDSLYPQNVKEIILQTLKPLPSLDGYVRYAGIPDAAAALMASDLLVSDTTAPTLAPTTSFHENEILVELHPEDLGGSGYRMISYAVGKRYISYFRHGTAGFVLKQPSLVLSKSGTYTFYISDYAGNENTVIYEVMDDNTPPAVTASYRKTPDGSYIVSLQVTVEESGVRQLRYQQGFHTIENLQSFGFDLDIENPTFTSPFEGVYSVFVSDYRGNKAAYEIQVRYNATKRIFLSTQEITLTVGETFRPQVLLFPSDASDTPELYLNGVGIAELSEDGTVTALLPGTALLSVTAGSVEKTCLIHVVEKAEPLPETTEPSMPEDNAEVPEDNEPPTTEDNATPTTEVNELPTSERDTLPSDVPEQAGE